MQRQPDTEILIGCIKTNFDTLENIFLQQKNRDGDDLTYLNYLYEQKVKFYEIINNPYVAITSPLLLKRLMELDDNLYKGLVTLYEKKVEQQQQSVRGGKKQKAAQIPNVAQEKTTVVEPSTVSEVIILIEKEIKNKPVGSDKPVPATQSISWTIANGNVPNKGLLQKFKGPDVTFDNTHNKISGDFAIRAYQKQKETTVDKQKETIGDKQKETTEDTRIKADMINDTKLKKDFLDAKSKIDISEEWYEHSLRAISSESTIDNVTYLGVIKKEYGSDKITDALLHRYTKAEFVKSEKEVKGDQNTLYFIENQKYGLKQYTVYYFDPITELRTNKPLNLAQSERIDKIRQDKKLGYNRDIFKDDSQTGAMLVTRMAAICELTPEFKFLPILNEVIKEKNLTIDNIMRPQIEAVNKRLQAKKEEFTKNYEDNKQLIKEIETELNNAKTENIAYDTLEGKVGSTLLEAGGSRFDKMFNDPQDSLTKLATLKTQNNALNNPNLTDQSVADRLQVSANDLKKSLDALKETSTKILSDSKTRTDKKRTEVETFEKGLQADKGKFKAAYEGNLLKITEIEGTLANAKTEYDNYNTVIKKYGSPIDKVTNAVMTAPESLATRLNELKESNKTLIGELKNKDTITTLNDTVTTLSTSLGALETESKDTLTKYKELAKATQEEYENIINYNAYQKKYAEFNTQLTQINPVFTKLKKNFELQKIWDKPEYQERLLSYFEQTKTPERIMTEFNSMITNLTTNQNTAKSKIDAHENKPITAEDIKQLDKDIADLSKFSQEIQALSAAHDTIYTPYLNDVEAAKKSAIEEIKKANNELDWLTKKSIPYQITYQMETTKGVKYNGEFNTIAADNHMSSINSRIGNGVIFREYAGPKEIAEKTAKEISEINNDKQKVIADNRTITKKMVDRLKTNLEAINFKNIDDNLALAIQLGISVENALQIFPSIPRVTELAAYISLARTAKNMYDQTLSKPSLIDENGFLRENQVKTIKEIEQVTKNLQDISQYLNMVNVINAYFNLDETQKKYNFPNNTRLYEHFKHDVIQKYMNASLEERSSHDYLEKYLDQVIKETKSKFDRVDEITRKLDNIYKNHGYMPTNLGNLLAELKNPSIKIEPGDLWITQMITHIEHELPKNYWEQRKEQSIFSPLPHKKIADELQKVLTDSLKIQHKYGVEIPKKVKGVAPNIKEIIKIQNGDFQIAVDKLRFKKTQKLLQYARDHQFLGKNETLNLDTDEGKASARIIIQQYVYNQLNKRSGENLGESKSDLTAFRNLLSPAQMHEDESRFPFTCALQRLKIRLSPSHLTTHRKFNVLMQNLNDLAGDKTISEQEKASRMKGYIEKECADIRTDIQAHKGTGISRFWAPSKSRLEKALSDFTKTGLKDVIAIEPPQRQEYYRHSINT